MKTDALKQPLALILFVEIALLTLSVLAYNHSGAVVALPYGADSFVIGGNDLGGVAHTATLLDENLSTTYGAYGERVHAEEAHGALTPSALLVERLVGGRGSLAGMIISLLLIFCNGILLSRIVSRYSVSNVRSFIPMILYTIAVCLSSSFESILPQLVALFLIMGCARLVASFKRTIIYAPLFEGYFLIGILPILVPATLPIAVGILAVMFIYERTMREFVVGLGGLLLPTLLCSWLWWLCDGAEPLAVVFSIANGLHLDTSAVGQLFTLGALPVSVPLFYMTALSLLGTALVIAAGNDMRTRPKKICYHFALIFLLGLASLLLMGLSAPAVGVGELAGSAAVGGVEAFALGVNGSGGVYLNATLTAIFGCGFAVIAHTCFVRWRSVWATVCYVVLLLIAFASIALRLLF